MNILCIFCINKWKFCRIEFNKSIQLYSWIIGLPFTITSHKMVSGNGVGGAGWMGGGAEFRVFLYKKCFFYYSSKILYVKIKTFAWKKSFLCAWKFTANTWKFKKKSTWKSQTVREISEKSIREKRLPYVKKLKKSPKKRFTHTFYFHVQKKNTGEQTTLNLIMR